MYLKVADICLQFLYYTRHIHLLRISIRHWKLLFSFTFISCWSQQLVKWHRRVIHCGFCSCAQWQIFENSEIFMETVLAKWQTINKATEWYIWNCYDRWSLYLTVEFVCWHVPNVSSRSTCHRNLEAWFFSTLKFCPVTANDFKGNIKRVVCDIDFRE
jgi:hypothetical protein